MYEQLKSELEDAAFMLVDDASRKEVHAKIINCLVLLEKHHINDKGEFDQLIDSNEVSKVSRRLRMWARPERQSQYNARILNSFLELERHGRQHISENDLFLHVGEEDWFWPNYVQMKSISERNHGKVFEVVGDIVSIWSPIEPAVREYERRVFE